MQQPRQSPFGTPSRALENPSQLQGYVSQIPADARFSRSVSFTLVFPRTSPIAPSTILQLYNIGYRSPVCSRREHVLSLNIRRPPSPHQLPSYRSCIGYRLMFERLTVNPL